MTDTTPSLPGSQFIDRLRQQVARNPQDGEAWLQLARALSPAPASVEARTAIDRSIALLPDCEEAWLLAGFDLARRGGVKEAQRWLDLIARQKPGIAAPRLAVARLIADHDATAALGVLEKLAEEFRGDGRVAALLADLARHFLATDRLDLTLAAATRAIELDPSNPEPRCARADAHRLSGAWGAALADYRAVEFLRPGDARLVNNIGCCLAGLGQLGPAQNCFERALDLAPGLAEASLNLALALAADGHIGAAISRIEQALGDDRIDPATQQRARTTAALLAEQERLQPFLDHAGTTAQVDELQRALDLAPGSLAQPDSAALVRLRDLADRCRQWAIPGEESWPAALGSYGDFLEAIAQHEIGADAAGLARLYRDSACAGPVRPAAAPGLTHALRVTRERHRHDPDELSGPCGEAWLRYWQLQLTAGQPRQRPGQFKAIVNALGGRSLTAPEQVRGTVRALLAELRPQLPGGLRRGIFLLVALNWIHGFVDGNGRLARFVLAWEMEAAGRPPLIIPSGSRKAVAAGMDVAWLEGDLAPLLAALRTAGAATQKTRGELERALREP